jgi:hypothetical protein
MFLTNKEVEVRDQLVLTNQGGCQTQLAVRLDNGNDLHWHQQDV